MRIPVWVGLAVACGLLVGTSPPVAALQTCAVTDTETKAVLPGVTMTWDSSFLCAAAPDSDTYRFTVWLKNHGGSDEAVEITRLRLVHTTPKVRGEGPDATGVATGLPQTLSPGETGEFTVRGSYELVRTDEGKKANLHFQAVGRGVASGDKFRLGINAMFRAPGAAE